MNTGGVTKIYYPRGYEIKDSEEGRQETRDAYERARIREMGEGEKRKKIIIAIVVVLLMVILASVFVFR